MLSIDVLDAAAPVNGVIIHLDQTITGDWNEIDAVELVGVLEMGSEVSLWASSASATSQYSDTSWSARQVTGAPDSPECADQATAWASETSSGQDVLTVTVPAAGHPTRLDIVQTYNPWRHHKRSISFSRTAAPSQWPTAPTRARSAPACSRWRWTSPTR